MMRQISSQEVGQVAGGHTLTDGEASNAFIMGGSVAVPVVGVYLFNQYLGSLVGGAGLLRALAHSTVAGVTTGVGVYLGYQLYYSFYGSEGG